jgi:hypothetical protein
MPLKVTFAAITLIALAACSSEHPTAAAPETVAEVYKDDQSVGLQLVAEGYAVIYDRYLNSCAESHDDYLQAEARAEAVLNAFPGDPHRLDGDDDGIPCESLR